jgi:hypothetical protein
MVPNIPILLEKANQGIPASSGVENLLDGGMGAILEAR